MEEIHGYGRRRIKLRKVIVLEIMLLKEIDEFITLFIG
jgi:hypothetical protein